MSETGTTVERLRAELERERLRADEAEAKVDRLTQALRDAERRADDAELALAVEIEQALDLAEKARS